MMKQKGIRKVFFEGVPASKSENKKNGIFYKKQLKQVKGVVSSHEQSLPIPVIKESTLL